MFMVMGSWHSQVRKICMEQILTSVFFTDGPKGGGQDARNNPAKSRQDSVVKLLGRRQAVRHQVLILAFAGSNPAGPAITNIHLGGYW